jgi:hypothetical protein
MLIRWSLKETTMTPEYRRGVLAAASAAADYNGSTTHAYRLDDSIACKLNVVRRSKPRRNRKAIQDPDLAWMRGVATALAEMHRTLLGGADSASVCRVATSCGLTLTYAKRCGVTAYDLKELRKAGVG